MASQNNCFVTGPLVESVELIDIAPSPPLPLPLPQQNQAQEQQKHESENVVSASFSRQFKFTDKSSLAAYLDNKDNKNYTCRYIAICQRNSFQPLQVTEEMLELILNKHDLGASFWDLTSAFYTRNLKTEQVFCVPYKENREGPFIDISYTIRYPEYKKDEEEWTLRQSGIYHRFNTETSQSTFILFNPTPSSKLHCEAQKQMLQHAADPGSMPPFWLHRQLFAIYIPAWRQYIASLERRFLPIANTAAATYINEELRVGHAHLNSLTSIQKDFLQIPTILAATTDVLTELNTLVASDFSSRSKSQSNSETQHLQNIQRQCNVYSRTATHLQERVQLTAQLLSNTLLFRDQVLANEQNGNMLQLNRSAVFLTTLTLLYLPASFLTSFFGMNFFAMDQQNNRIVGTPMIWIFLISAILLTVATFTMYYWLSDHERFFRTMAPKKWMASDLHLRKLTRRLTATKSNDRSNRTNTGV